MAQVGKECGSGSKDQRPHCLILLAATSSSHIVVSWWNTRTAAPAVA
jgi:hypothetical protein